MFVPLGFRILDLVQPPKKKLEGPHISPHLPQHFQRCLEFWRQFKEKQIPGPWNPP